MPPTVSSRSTSLSSPSIDTLLLVLAVVGFAALAMACITVPLARRRAVARGGRRAVTDLRRAEAMETEEGLLEDEDGDEPAPTPKKWEWHSTWTMKRADAGAGGRHGETRRGPSEDGPTAGPSRVRSRPEDGQLRVEVNISQELHRDKTPKRTRPSLSLVPRTLKMRSSLNATPPSSKRRSFLPRLGALSPLMEIPWAEDHRFHLPLAPKIPPPLPPEDAASPSTVSEQPPPPERVHLSDASGTDKVPSEDLHATSASPGLRLVTPSRRESPSVRAKGPRQRSTSASLWSKLGQSSDARNGSSPSPGTFELTPLPASESSMDTGRPALRAGQTENGAEAGPSGLSAPAGSSQAPSLSVPSALVPSNRNSMSTATQISPIPPPPRHPAAATDSQDLLASPPALTMAFLSRPAARAGTPSSAATTQISTWPSVGTVVVGPEGSPGSTSQAIAAGAIPASLRAATQPELPTLLEGPTTPRPSGLPRDHQGTDERPPEPARLPDADTSGLLQSLRVKGLESLASMEEVDHRPGAAADATPPAVPASLRPASRAASMPPAATSAMPTGRGGPRAGSLPSGGGTAAPGTAHTLNGHAAGAGRNHTIPPSLRPRSSSTMSTAGSDDARRAQDFQDLGGYVAEASSSTPRARLHANTVSLPYSVETPRPRPPSAKALTVTEGPDHIPPEERRRPSLEHRAPQPTTHNGRDKAGSRKGKERATGRETHGGNYLDARAQPLSLGHQKASRSHDETRPRPRWPEEHGPGPARSASDDDGPTYDDAQLLRSASTPTKKKPRSPAGKEPPPPARPNTPTRAPAAATTLLVKRQQSVALRPLPASLVLASRSNPAAASDLRPAPAVRAGDALPGLASPYVAREMEPARMSSPTLPPLVFPSLSVEMLDMQMGT